MTNDPFRVIFLFDDLNQVTQLTDLAIAVFKQPFTDGQGVLIEHASHISQMSTVTAIPGVIDDQCMKRFDMTQFGCFEINVGIGFSTEHFIGTYKHFNFVLFHKRLNLGINILPARITDDCDFDPEFLQ